VVIQICLHISTYMIVIFWLISSLFDLPECHTCHYLYTVNFCWILFYKIISTNLSIIFQSGHWGTGHRFHDEWEAWFQRELTVIVVETWQPSVTVPTCSYCCKYVALLHCVCVKLMINVALKWLIYSCFLLLRLLLICTSYQDRPTAQHFLYRLRLYPSTLFHRCFP